MTSHSLGHQGSVTQHRSFEPPDRGQGARHGMALGLRHLDLKARQPGPLLMRQAVASLLCLFLAKVDRTAAFSCEAHIDDAKGIAEALQLRASSAATPR